MENHGVGTLGKVLWVLFGGLALFISYALTGIFLYITIVGRHWGHRCFRLARYSLMPFNKRIVEVDRAETEKYLKLEERGYIAKYALWLAIFGLTFVVSHIGYAFFFVLTIIGIPFAKKHIELARLAIMPFGKDFEFISGAHAGSAMRPRVSAA